VNRQSIFFDRQNYLFFLTRIREYLLGEKKSSKVFKTLELSNREPSHRPVIIIAYCLMPNHFHLLLRPCLDDLSHRMQLFGISYTKAINARYSRVGPLFQGKFQAVRVDTDEYLLHLSRYIHLNPVVAGLVKRPEEWEFSSYRDYLGLRRGTLPDPDSVLAHFPTPAAYQQFVDSNLTFDPIKHLLFNED
jgi:REP element-mobilizing transposase RayT